MKPNDERDTLIAECDKLREELAAAQEKLAGYKELSKFSWSNQVAKEIIDTRKRAEKAEAELAREKERREVVEEATQSLVHAACIGVSCLGFADHRARTDVKEALSEALVRWVNTDKTRR